MDINTSIGINKSNLSNSEISEKSMLNHTHTLNWPFAYGMQSMPDYANMIHLCSGDNSYVFKVNVPGYIFVHFGHCSDTDYVLWCSYDPKYLIDIRKYPTEVFKLGEGFGMGDRDQSSIFIPIVPGTSTYVRPARDNSLGNVANMNWFFIPTFAMRQFQNKKSKFIVKKSDKINYYHVDRNTTGFNKISKIFNTLSNPNIWINNL